MRVLLTLIFVCSTLLSLPSSTSAQREESYYYSSRYDNIDINNIFRSRLLNNYVDCLLDKKPCPPEGKDLKRVLPDALKTRCERCSKIQKEKALDVITRLYYQHPKLYTALAERYDPTGEYTRNYERWFDDQNAVKPRPAFQEQSGESKQPEVRRSPSSSSFQGNVNNLPTEKTRIPSTWISSTTTQQTNVRRVTTARATLRTTVTPLRTTTEREEIPQIFREVAPIFRTAAVPTSTTLRPSPTFRQTPRTAPAVRFDDPVIVREFQSTPRAPESTFRQTNTFVEPSTILRAPEKPFEQDEASIIYRDPIRAPQKPFEQDAAPIISRDPITTSTRTTQQFVTRQRLSPPEENSRPSVIFRDPTTSTTQLESSTFRTPVVRNQPPIVPPSVTNEPRFRTSVPEVLTPQETPQIIRRPSVPVRDSPILPVRDSPVSSVYKTQIDLQEKRTPVSVNPTESKSPLSPVYQEAPTVNKEQSFVRNLEAQERRNEPVQPANEPDLIDRFFVADMNGRFRKSVERLMDTTGKVVGNVAGMIRSSFQAITKLK